MGAHDSGEAADPTPTICLLTACPPSELASACDTAAAALLAAEHIRSGNATVVGASVAGALAASPALDSLRILAADSGGHGGIGTAAFVEQLRGRCAVVVGAALSAVSMPVAAVAASSDQALLSFGSTAMALSDKSIYPLFARTVPSDSGNVETALDVIDFYGWAAFAVLAVNDAWGMGLSTSLRVEGEARGFRVTVATFDPVSVGSIEGAVERLRSAGHRIIVLATHATAAERVFNAAADAGLAGDSVATVVWISIETAPDDMLAGAGDPAALGPLLRGALHIEPSIPSGDALDNLLSVWPSLDPASPAFDAMALPDNIFDTPPASLALYAYDAVWLAAMGMHAAYEAGAASGGGSSGGEDAVASGAEVLAAMRSVDDLVGVTGSVALDENGDRRGGGVSHSISSVVDDAGSLVVLATRDNDGNFAENVDMHDTVWADGTTEVPLDGLTCPARMQFVGSVRGCAPRLGILFRAQDEEGQPLAGWRIAGSLMGALALEHWNAGDLVGAPSLNGLAMPPIVGEFRDTNQSPKRVTSAVLEMISSAGGLAGVVAYSKSSTSRAGARVAGAFDTAYLSSSATASSLSDTEEFPFFARSVPPDSIVATAMAHVVKSWNILRVAFIGEGDAYGIGFEKDFSLAAGEIGVEVASVQHWTASYSIAEAVQAAVASKARAFVLIGQDAQMVEVLAEMERLGATGAGVAFFVADASSPSMTQQNGAPARIAELAQGIIRVQPAVRDNARLDALREVWAALDVDEVRLRYPQLQLADDFFEQEDVQAAGAFFYDAVLSACLAINASLPAFRDAPDAVGQLVMEQIPQVQFEGASGRVAFNAEGDRSQESATIGIDNFVFDGDGGLVASHIGTWSADFGRQLYTGARAVWPGSQDEPPNDGAQCGAGFIFDLDTLLCVPCARGTAFDPDTFECVPCEAGRYAPEPGMSDCVSCDTTGGYSSGNGSSTCSACPSGTARTVGTPGVDVSECVCKERFYTLSGPGVECTPCPEGAVCLGGLQPPFPQPGYWADPAFPDVMLHCPAAESCEGGANHSCAPGSQGRLCSECAPGYYKFGVSCSVCPSDPTLASLQTLGLVLAVLVLWLAVNAVSGNVTVIDQALLFAQVVNHIQLMALKWPESLGMLTTVFTALNFDTGFVSPSCAVESWNSLWSYTLQFSLPFVWIAASVLLAMYDWLHFWAYRSARYCLASSLSCCMACRRAPHTRAGLVESQDRLIRQQIILAIVMYNTFSKQALDAFLCTEVADGESFVTFMPIVSCGSEEHRMMQWIAVAAVVVYIIGTPLVLFSIIYVGRRDNQLRNAQYLRRYGFLYRRYTPVAAYWELALLGRRAAISFVLGWLQGAPYKQVIAGTLVIAGALVFHMSVLPFNSRVSNRLELMALGCSLLYLTSGPFFQFGLSFSDELAFAVQVTTWGGVAVCVIFMLRVAYFSWKARTAAHMLELAVEKEAPSVAHGHRGRVARQRRELQKTLQDRKRTLGRLDARGPSPLGRLSQTAVGEPSSDSDSHESDNDASARDSTSAGLGLAESHMVRLVRGPYLMRWLDDSKSTLPKLRAFLSVDAWLDPFCAEWSFASRYSRVPVARLWRELLDRFPWLLDALMEASPGDLEAFRHAMMWLAPAFARMHGTSSKARVYRVLHRGLLSPVALWFTLYASKQQRKTLVDLMRGMAGAEPPPPPGADRQHNLGASESKRGELARAVQMTPVRSGLARDGSTRRGVPRPSPSPSPSPSRAGKPLPHEPARPSPLARGGSRRQRAAAANMSLRKKAELQAGEPTLEEVAKLTHKRVKRLERRVSTGGFALDVLVAHGKSAEAVESSSSESEGSVDSIDAAVVVEGIDVFVAGSAQAKAGDGSGGDNV